MSTNAPKTDERPSLDDLAAVLREVVNVAISTGDDTGSVLLIDGQEYQAVASFRADALAVGLLQEGRPEPIAHALVPRDWGTTAAAVLVTLAATLAGAPPKFKGGV